MQAKKRYILVFVSCAFLAYCYFGGYRLKRARSALSSSPTAYRHERIIVPPNLPSFLSSIECNGLDDEFISDADDNALDATAVSIHNSHANNENVPSSNSAGTAATAQISIANKINNESPHLPAILQPSNKRGVPKANHIDSKVQVPVVELPAIGGNANRGGDRNSILDGIAKTLGHGDQRNQPCRMETCFDYSKCNDVNQQFLVYVYPPDAINALGNTPPISLNYQKILSAITESRYYTPDPERACLFVLGIDTLDRDSLSEDYVRNVPSRLQRLPYWNNGRNHVIFNLYSGTWPDYAENSLGFDTGEAILAKASMSVRQIRPGFDISIPLFHKQHPLRAGNTGFVVSNNFPTNKKYLLAFKGKR